MSSIASPLLTIPATGTPLPVPRVNRLDWLLALRAAACFLVILGHCWTPPNEYGNVLVIGQWNLSYLFRSNASAGVWLFFTLSGYLMGKAFWSGRYALTLAGMRHFLTNRALRICPLYFFVILATLALVPHHDWQYIPPVLRALFTFRCAVCPICWPWWSISTEVQFYLLAPLLAWLFIPRITRVREIACIALLFLAFSIIIPYEQTYYQPGMSDHDMYIDFLYTPLTANLALFVIGWLVNPLLKLWRPRVQLHSAWIALICLALYVPLAWQYRAAAIRAEYCSDTLNRMMPFIVALIGAGLIFIIESRERGVKREVLTVSALRRNPWRVMEWGGILSYGLYLWHGNVLGAVTIPCEQYIPAYLPCLLVRLCCTIALTTMIALVSYRAIEQPFERMKTFDSSVKSPEVEPGDGHAVSDYGAS